MIRSEPAVPGLQLVDEEGYNQLFTMHGTIMMLLFATPAVAGLANYLIPLQVGAADMVFPRLNALSFWLFLFGGLIVISGYLAAGGPADVGGTGYPPNSELPYSTTLGTDLWIVGLADGVASIFGAINFVSTIYTRRAPGMSMLRVPIFTWTVLVTSALILFSFPALTGALVMLLLDRRFGTAFFDPSEGGSVILWQHLFWFFGHPEVYIVALPFFGVISEIIPVFSRKPLFGYRFFVLASILIGAVLFTVWAHHMFTTGAVSLPFFSITTFIIAVPTGIKFFNWIGTMGRPADVPDPDAVGGRLPVPVPDRRPDRRDPRFPAARLPPARHLLRGGPLPRRARRRLGLRAVRGDLLLVPEDDRPAAVRAPRQAAFLVLAHRLHAGLLRPVPARRRGDDAALRRLPGRRRLDDLNLVSTAGAFLLGFGTLPFLLAVGLALRRPADQPADPWGANSLEWATTSPPPHHNFPAIPPIRSERPVFDARVAPSEVPNASRLPFADQPQETRFFLVIAGWAGALGVVYWFVSYEAGTVLLAGLALATGTLSVWLMRSQRLRRRRAEAGPESATGRSRRTRRDASLLRRWRRSRSASGSRSLRSDPCLGSPRSPWVRCRSCGVPARGSVRGARSSTRRNATAEGRSAGACGAGPAAGPTAACASASPG